MIKNEISIILEYNHLKSFAESLDLKLVMEADTWFLTNNEKIIIVAYKSLECISAFLSGIDFIKNELEEKTKTI